MADVTMEQMVKKAHDMQKLADEAGKEMDPEKAREYAERLLAEGRALEKMGEQMRAEATKKRGGLGRVEVVLTAQQRKRVHDKTGIALESLIIDDEAGAMNQSMPMARPEYIEKLAMEEAERRKHAAEAERMVRAELDRAMAEIEAVGVAELSEQLEKLKQDPNFAGGLLQKKK
jgi:hypothetical protein